MTLLEELNSGQFEAATTTEGPVLILAGAGTGKTRAITYRIANLIEKGVPGNAILAVTFTNKAAEQMKERIRDLMVRDGKAFDTPWVGTFHAFSAWLLRREAPRLGLPRDFKIFDADDQMAAVKLALEHLNIKDPGEKVRGLLERISNAKNRGQTSAQISADAAKSNDPLGITAAKVYEEYEKILRKAGALDFDDLLLRTVQVLREFPEARANWQSRFRYIHVDEYQDTNRVQYDLLRLLVNESRNLCVVGDEDQSIYRWRGADVGNILRFADDYPGARVVRLEENYRSTQKILDAAGAVVAHNRRRLGKNLKATLASGNLLAFYEARDAKAEAEYVADCIRTLHDEDPSVHVAVLYRTNAQSRSFEEALRARGMRYRMLGGFSFYQRAEVKDALAYARLALFPDDDIALLRVINTPPRGIGKTSIDSLTAVARQNDLSLWAAIGKVIDGTIPGRALAPLRDFRTLIEELQLESAGSPADFLQTILSRTGYLDMLSQRDSAEDTARADNLRELVNAMAEGAERGETLSDFLDRAALVSDADNYDEAAQITLMSLHSAKGLEFDHVFLTGMEEGVFPHSRSQTDEEDLEEERRLCYVGMTRAKTTLTLTRAVYRRMYGSERLSGSMPSRFLQEIPGELIETAQGSLAEVGETRRYEPDPEYSYSEEEFARRMHRGQYAPTRTPAPAASRPRSSGSARPNKKNSNPLIGQRVRHASYGVGTVIDVEEDGEDRKLTVRFSDYGVKKLLERYANLTWA